ncbi:MAG: histidine phosphatase family protein [Pseudomonadota bacterium]|nr:histidine phosphatase family protein [Pseudomonadota bacterium]
MSELVFVRHGQASFGAASYDALSERGFEQVRELAKHWLETGESFQAIYSGTLQRQRETAIELASVVTDQVAPQRMESLNEYHGDPLIHIYLRDHAEREGVTLPDAWPIKDNKIFQSVLEAASACWIRDELKPQDCDKGFEYCGDFKRRVFEAVDQIMAANTGGRKVLVSTSGGVIATALQRVLGFSDQQAIATNWMVHNSSVTRVRYGGGRVSLLQFNSMPHLERQGKQHLITFR